MDKFIMNGKEYRIVSNENQYDLEVNKNNLFLKKEGIILITLDLEDTNIYIAHTLLKRMGIMTKRTDS